MRKCPETRLKRPEAGYTLTEMLVVIAIIGLIAAVLTPNLLGQLQRARVKSAQLQLDTLASNIEVFRSDVGRYPTKAEGLQSLVQEPEGVEGWTGPYARDSRTLNDPWGAPVSYIPSNDGRSFYVESLGADGQREGSGVNRDLRSPAAAAPPPAKTAVPAS